MATIRIVPATESDVPVLLDLIRQLAEYEKLSHIVKATEERLRGTLFGESPAAEAILAYFDQECAGFALFFVNYSTFLAQKGLYLEDLYVKSHLRDRGIGYALLTHLAKIATSRDCGRLEWEVLDWNEPSVQFYRRLGAVAMDDWTKYRLTGDALQRLAGL